MSIRTRFEDAHLLAQHKRLDGALLSILVAAAATSRRRYPKSTGKNDREAFTQFLFDEMPVLTFGLCEGNLSFEVKNANIKYYPDKKMPLQDVLYEFVRCSLAHEGVVNDNVKFLESDSGLHQLAVTEDGIELPAEYFNGLAKLVEFAPENFDCFPNVKNLPLEVAAWFLLGKRRESHKKYLEARSSRVMEHPN